MLCMSRLPLYALSARNKVGLALGLSMDQAYTSEQRLVAQESCLFWRNAKLPDCSVYALLGNEEGETSFKWTAVGDAKTGGAHGIFQWHAVRIALIRKYAGIDILSPKVTHEDMLRAALWEMTAPESSYRKVMPALKAATTIDSAIDELVVRYEQSGSQARDIIRRTQEAKNWQTYGDANWERLAA